MNKIHFKWKYGCLVIAMAAICACSDHNELAQMADKQEQQNGTRTAELFTKTITLTTAGTLETELTTAMGGTDVATLEKLVISGPFTSTDMTYLRNHLTGLVAIDMKDAVIKASSEQYCPDGWSYHYFEDNKLGYWMFGDMSSLVEIILPTSITSIDSGAFSNCHSLTSITIPDGVTELGDYLFQNCQTLSEVTLPSNIGEIGYSTFRNCNLKSVVIPESVTTIGSSAFESCDSLTSITLPSGLTSLGEQAFRACYNLSSIIIPDGVKRIEQFTFYDCHSLSSIQLPSQLEFIGGYAFSSCALTSVVLPSTLKTLSGCAFEYCRSLESITIPSGVESIGGHTFFDCDALKELTIPETITSVDRDFANAADGIQAIYWKAPIDVPYNGASTNCFLYIETDQAITADECWKNVIVNGVAKSTITIEANNNSYACLKEFTAPEVVYTRSFRGETVPGTPSGWQTIVLPFVPDSIYHESKGRVAPFNSNIEGAKNFWLRELTSDGFVDVPAIEANKAYLIAMPNHYDYLDEYRLDGVITFTAKNVTIKKTPDTLQPSVGPDFDFHPTYQYVKKALYVYSLESQWDYYNNKGCEMNYFARSRSDVHAFNAYVTAPGGGRSSRSTYDIDTRSKETRAKYSPNNTGIPQIGDM